MRYHGSQGDSTGPRFDNVLDELPKMTGLQLSFVEGEPVNDICDLDN